MKKLLLSLLASTIYTSTVSAQSCQQPPTCAEMGYTKSESDCTGKTTLKCPFDLTKVSCDDANLSSSIMSTPIILKVKVTTASSTNEVRLSFSYNGVLLYTDCGNGYSTSSTCYFSENGEYSIKYYGMFYSIEGWGISGTGSSSVVPSDIQILSLNHPLLREIHNVCSSTYIRNKLTGTIPEIPSNITNISNAFRYCSKLSGTLPEYTTLPNLITVTDAFYISGITKAANPSWPAEAW